MSELSLLPDGTVLPRPNGSSLNDAQYYITTNINGHLFPLASVNHYTTLDDSLPDSGRQIPYSLMGIINVLRDPANRLAIESERLMAVDYCEYASEMDMPDWPHPTESDLVWHKFPITHTCALLGASSVIMGPEGGNDHYKFDETDLTDMHTYGHSESSGMVIIDITDLDHIRYGIMLFDDFLYDTYIQNVVMEEGTTRVISASDYVAAFLPDHDQYEDDVAKAQELDEFSLIGTETIIFEWPRSIIKPRGPADYHSVRPLFDQSLDALILSTQEIESYDMSIFEWPRLVRGFKMKLRKRLFEEVRFLPETPSVGQLLALAYDEETQLNLVRLVGLSAGVLRAALETDILKNVTELSIRIDDIRNTPEEVIDAVSSGPSLRHVCFLTGPLRDNDAWSVEYWKLMRMKPELLKRIKFTFTEAYSKGITRSMWLDPWWVGTYYPPRDVFPVLNMLVSQVDRKDGEVTSKRHPFYLGHSFLGAEAFAARFLRWLPDVARHDGHPFSIGPPTLASTSKAEVLPITRLNDTLEYPQGSWAALVFKHTITEGDIKFESVKYAFVELNSHLDPGDFYREPEIYSVEPYDLHKVVGLKEFLQIMAPDVDQSLVDRLLQEAEQKIDEKNAEFERRRGRKYRCLTVFNVDEACEMLSWSWKRGLEEINLPWCLVKGVIEYL
ncbi:hypothetical protein F4805DRAFT_477556 [Annulohypoxylon moriforme]|nr:hypothetical protein F4805DRAFT_477556 [Annulohypoxylon moriforme]